jgi:hypothetical protein
VIAESVNKEEDEKLLEPPSEIDLLRLCRRNWEKDRLAQGRSLEVDRSLN